MLNHWKKHDLKKKKKKRDISHAYRFSLPGSPLTLSVSSLSSNLLLHPRPTPSEPKTKPPTSQDNGDRREFPQLQSLHLPAFIPILFLSLLPQGKKGLSYPQPTPPHSCSLTHLRYSFLSLSLQLPPLSSSFSAGSLPPAFKQLTLQLHRCLYLSSPSIPFYLSISWIH